jgi:hypothetical protein
MSVTGTNLASATGATTLTSLQDGDLFYAERSGAPGRITYANIRTDIAGRAWTFGEPITFSAAATFSGAITASDIVTVAMDNARFNLHDTSGTPNTHAMAGTSYNNSAYSLIVRTNTGAFVENAYTATFADNGAATHSWRQANSEVMRLGGTGPNFGKLRTFGVAPLQDAAYDSGQSDARWVFVWALVGTIQTSDERQKDIIGPLSEAEARLGQRLKALVKTFRWKSGPSSKKHTGLIAQEIIAAFEAEGLDWQDYGVITGGGDEPFGVNYNEVWALIIGGL